MNGNIHGIILPIIALVEFIFAYYLIFRKQKNEISRSLGLFFLFVGLWALGLGLYKGLGNDAYAFIAAKSTYVSAAFIATSFVYFSLIYPFKTRHLKALDAVAIITPGVIVIFLLIFSDLLLKEMVIVDWGRDIIIGPAYHFYGTFFLIYWAWSFKNLIKKYLATDGIHRQQMRLVLWGVGISLATGSFFALLQPWFYNYRYTQFGPESSVIFLAFTFYIIWKK